MSLPRRLVRMPEPAAVVDADRRRGLLVGIVALSLGLSLRWPLVLVVVVSMPVAARLVRRRRRRVHHRRAITELSAQLPGVITVLQLAALSGHPPRQAVLAAGRTGRGHAVAVFARAGRRLDAGADLAEALDGGPDEASPDVQRVNRLLVRAERDGVAYGPDLAALASDLRRERLARLDAASSRLGVTMLFPLVICILPAFVLLSVLPLVSAVLSDLMP